MNLTKIALTTLALFIAGTTVASAYWYPPTHDRLPTTTNNNGHPNYAVECRVHGDNFYIMNWGNSVLDSGLQIEWGSPTTGDGGRVLLPKMLAPGEEVKLADVLSADVLPHSPCNVAIV
jgi:hypothetical protein